MAKGQRKSYKTKKEFEIYATGQPGKYLRPTIRKQEPLATISCHSPEEAREKGLNLALTLGLQLTHIKEKGINENNGNK